MIKTSIAQETDLGIAFHTTVSLRLLLLLLSVIRLILILIVVLIFILIPMTKS